MRPESKNRSLDMPSESTDRGIHPEFTIGLTTNVQLLGVMERVDSHPMPAPSLHGMEIELQRMLSLRTVISTASSEAKRHMDAQSQTQQVFRKIGAGACGSIFAQDGKAIAIKLNKAADDTEVLYNDYMRHSQIIEALAEYNVSIIKVPECYYYVPEHKTDFFEARPKLMEAAQAVCNLPTSALVTERILPLPEATRAALIDKYCVPKNKTNAMEDPANKDCLVRVYLGSTQGKSTGMFFSLRNFKMHLNQMLEIQLDVQEMAYRMAMAMAVMHWAAGTDARDVEFVLGSSARPVSKAWSARDIAKAATQHPKPYTGPESLKDEDFFHRKTELWLLDFNQVDKITFDAAGVSQAVNAVVINDPYFPKPLQPLPEQKRIWNKFAESYLDMARNILQGRDKEILKLPDMFIRGLIEAEKARQDRHVRLAEKDDE